MKDMKRAIRRHQKETILKRRAKLNFAIGGYPSKTWSEFWVKIKEGACSWMRTLSKPCSCDVCSPHYKRPCKGEMSDIIDKELLK